MFMPSRLARFIALAALGLATPALAEETLLLPATSQQIQTTSTDMPTADRAGPWGNSAYTFSLKVSTSIFKTVNLHREKKGLGRLEADAGLGLLAGTYASDMVTGDFFGHFSPDGRDLDARVADAGLGYYAQIAEILWDADDDNLSWSIEQTVRNAVTDWLNSPEGHREALLDPKLTVTGIGTAVREKRIVVAMLLGRR